MSDKYEDFDQKKMNQLEKQVETLIEKDEENEVYNYQLKDEINWQDIGWTEGTGEKALLYLRRHWKDKQKINVRKERDGNIIRKVWVKTK